MMGAVDMEPRDKNSTRTDHDRDPAVNGVNGMSAVGSQRDAPGQERVAVAAAKDRGSLNGGEVGETALDRSRQLAPNAAGPSTETRSRMNDLPDEIIHITQGFVPLSLLLTRLAQVTHNSLQDKVAELAKMPWPTTAVNGSSSMTAAGPDDSSSENIRKKAALATFAQDMHGKWLKALVITEWSRKADMVSKLIDLKFHIDQQRLLYDAALDNVVNLKRDLTFARMPSPDLKTALQVLSTGTAPWMPDLNYIGPPPLTPDQQLKWMGELDTLLSLRLNLDDYDKIPYHFRKYEIASGRVTFKVDGEFEVDLTIADEDFEKQFWFIDFRYAFAPAASSVPESLRAYLEGCVNEALGKNGLAGCYQFLHEFVLTSKINELKRQAVRLSRSSWTGTLTVEPLNRALAIQYWTSRTATTGSKSWVLVAVHSSRKPNGQADLKTTSFLEARWYRDNKEMRDVEVELDVEKLSAESLLTDVIGRHIEFILKSIHDKLLTAPRFKNREGGMFLRASRSDPATSRLSIQVGSNDTATLLLEPTTGVFAVRPHSKFVIQFEHQLNNSKNVAEEGAGCLENVRCAIVEDELKRRAISMGWLLPKSPLTAGELRSVTTLRDWTRAVWLQKDGWGASWFVVVFLGLGGDEWWLLEADRKETKRAVAFKTRLPLHKGHPDLSEAFWNNFLLFTTGIMTQSVDVRELHRHNIKSKMREGIDSSLPQQVRLPSMDISLSALFPSMVTGRSQDGPPGAGSESEFNADRLKLFSLMQTHSGTALTPRQAWADDVVTIYFKGIQFWPQADDEAAQADGGELVCVSDAVIKVRTAATDFAMLKSMTDRDFSYDPQRSEFSLRMRRRVGKPMFDALKSRIKAIDRFVNCFEALANADGVVTSESATLRRVTFCYGDRPQKGGEGQAEACQARRPWRVVLDLSQDDMDVEIEEGNPHLRVMDLIRRLVNSDGGIGVLLAWLPTSLPALSAIEEMDKRWQSLEAGERGQLEFSMKTMAWMSIGYSIATPAGGRKHVALEMHMKPRRGEAWWHVWRSDAGGGAAVADEFDKALKPIWTGKGEGWLGLATGAAGRPGSGVVGMLLAVDDAIRGAAVGGTAAAAALRKPAHEVVVLD